MADGHVDRDDADDVDVQRIRQIDQQYDEDAVKLQKMRKAVSKKKRVRGRRRRPYG